MVEKIEEPKAEDEKEITKANYQLILKFGDYVIHAIDFVSWTNKYTDTAYVTYLDENGQIGDIKEENVGAIVNLHPSKELIKSFVNLKKQATKNMRALGENKEEPNASYL